MCSNSTKLSRLSNRSLRIELQADRRTLFVDPFSPSSCVVVPCCYARFHLPGAWTVTREMMCSIILAEAGSSPSRCCVGARLCSDQELVLMNRLREFDEETRRGLSDVSRRFQVGSHERSWRGAHRREYLWYGCVHELLLDQHLLA